MRLIDADALKEKSESATDTMNTYQGWDNGSGVKQYTTAVNDGTTTNFTLENDLARIQVSG